MNNDRQFGKSRSVCQYDTILWHGDGAYNDDVYDDDVDEDVDDRSAIWAWADVWVMHNWHNVCTRYRRFTFTDSITCHMCFAQYPPHYHRPLPFC